METLNNIFYYVLIFTTTSIAFIFKKYTWEHLPFWTVRTVMLPELALKSIREWRPGN